MRFLLKLALAAAFLVCSSLAAPASPQGEVYMQPDGTPVILFLKGDPHYNWMTDDNDFTVIRDYQNRWVYAKKMGGVLVSSGVAVGHKDPKTLGIVPNLKTDPDKRPVDLLLPSNENNRRRELRRGPLCSGATSSNPCTIRHLVVLVKFADHTSRNLPDPREYELLFNHQGMVDNDETLRYGSVNDLFGVNSNQALRVETVVSPVWLQSRYTEEYAVSTNFGKNLVETRAVWLDALSQLEQTGFDFSTMDSNGDGYVDSMAFVHSGVAAELPGLDCKCMMKGMLSF